MSLSTFPQLGRLLVSVAFAMHMANTWPTLSGRTAIVLPFLLTHAGVAVVFVSLCWRARRHQPVGPADLYVLAAVVRPVMEGRPWSAPEVSALAVVQSGRFGSTVRLSIP